MSKVDGPPFTQIPLPVTFPSWIVFGLVLAFLYVGYQFLRWIVEFVIAKKDQIITLAASKGKKKKKKSKSKKQSDSESSDSE